MSNPLEAFAGGVAGLFIGPPKTGKSTLLGSICEIVPPKEVALIVCKPTEVNSEAYVRYGLHKRAHYFHDHKWRPAIGQFETNGYLDLLRYIYSLYEDEQHSVVLLDPLTDVSALAGHELLKAYKVGTPQELNDTLSYYGAIRSKLRDVVQALTNLTAPIGVARPKSVFISIHAQPTKEEDIKKNPTAEGKAKGVSYFGDVLPSMEGSYRQDVPGEFDMVGFTFVSQTSRQVRPGKFEREVRYLVQAQPDPTKFAGVRLARLPELDYPNHLPTVLQAVVDSLKKAA